ncbi:expressed unknown protein [Seminavis robusta]|uniref:Uncharacterized protein n=1 Tax=Seminavis robusta TaxID=568900 RepID=A0A9N8H2X5_9STRA|nr:expressed unknown protein [Seminavis robusta]|eukprot:Sro75_g041200.1 n/a (536) ;mRNA; r:58110-59717
MKNPVSAAKFTVAATVVVSVLLLAGYVHNGIEHDVALVGQEHKQSIKSIERRKYHPPVTATEKTSIASPTREPLFVLSLPNHAELVLPRYFRCSGIPTEKIGRYWKRPAGSNGQGQQPIGACFRSNLGLKGKKNITDGCGDFDVWMDLHHLSGPYDPVHRTRPRGNCFDPVLYPDSLDQLYQAHPKATILNIVQDPQEWYTTLSRDFHWHWVEWCNPTHNNSFPTMDTEANYVQFYNNYQNKLRSFVQRHPSWTYIELDLRENQESIATRLHKELGIPGHCWADSFSAKVPEIPDEGDDDAFDGEEESNGGFYRVKTTTGSLFNELRFPILVTALPKSGTTTIYEYFRCGLGKWTAAHQGALNLTTFNFTTIGQCMMTNIGNGWPFLHKCGNSRMYSDIGVYKRKEKACYYPTLHGGLEDFAKAYPYGTILHIRRNFNSWYDSSNRWNRLLDRWSAGSTSLCQGVFPLPGSSKSDWENFYNHHNDLVEAFALQHPTLTYLDIPLGNAKTVLYDTFGFPSNCWGHANVNKKHSGAN